MTKEITGNEAYQEALTREPPNPRSGIAFYLYACCILGFFCSTMNGYDGSLFNSLMENTDFLNTYGGKNQVSDLLLLVLLSDLRMNLRANSLIHRALGLVLSLTCIPSAELLLCRSLVPQLIPGVADGECLLDLLPSLLER